MLPTSTIFDTADWNSRSGTTAETADSTLLDPTYGWYATSDWSENTLPSTEGVSVGVSNPGGTLLTSTTRVLGLGLSSKFTLEFDVSLVAAPLDFSSQDDRLFVGVNAPGGGTIGILFSQQGIAVASSPVTEPQVLQGSDSVLFDDDGEFVDSLTIRAVVGSDNRAFVYAGKTSEVYNGSVVESMSLLYTVLVPPSVLSDSQILLAARSKRHSSEMTLTSIRVSAASRIPRERPVGVIEAELSAVVGSTVVLDARGSYDGELAPLTYLWSVDSIPTGSVVTDSSTDQAFKFVPDVTGTYAVSLIVDNGTQLSSETIHTLHVVESTQLLGATPDSDYLFSTMSDFWNLVEDRDMISAHWSAMTQIISSEMFKMWQNDYAKSIRDIARKYQRKWLKYDHVVGIPYGTDTYVEVATPASHTVTPASSTANTVLQFTSTTEIAEGPVCVVASDGSMYTTNITKVEGSVHYLSAPIPSVSASPTAQVHQYPYFTVAGVSLTPSAFNSGDLVEVEVISPATAERVTVFVPIFATTDKAIFPDWRHPLSTWNRRSKLLTGTSVEIAGLDATLARIHRVNNIPVPSELLSVPTLGTVLGQDLVGNADYVLQSNTLTYLATYSSTAIATGSGIRTSQLALADALPDDATELVVTGPNAGVYPIIAKSSDGLTAVVSGVFNSGESLVVRMDRYSASSLPPLRQWAELSIYDNTSTIEKNFGILVGVRKSDLDNASVTADYLNIVKSLAFAFVHGPTQVNTQRAVQSFFDTPMSDCHGQIISLDEAAGTIVIKPDSTTVLKTYTYNSANTIALNPRTGVKFYASPLVDFSLANNQEELDIMYAFYEGSRVEPMDILIDSVEVHDFIEEDVNPVKYLGKYGEVLKAHTFVINKRSVTGEFNGSSLISDFVRSSKSARTDVLLMNTLLISDDVSVEESVGMSATLSVRDSLATAPWTDGTFPVETTTIDKGWDEAPNVSDKYESSYVSGVLDDYSGDGSWNESQREVDRVNHLDSDIDVPNSFMWLPITIDTPGFQVGESLYITDADGTTISDAGGVWYTNPPRVTHVGCGSDLKLPGIPSPQTSHPDTYLLVSFTSNVSTTGKEITLDAVAAMGAGQKIKGGTSGAIATVEHKPDRSDPADAPFFILDYVFRLDKLLEFGPALTQALTTTTYIPFGGVDVAELAVTELFVADDMQLQQFPHVSGLALVPSTTAGSYISWDPAPVKAKQTLLSTGAAPTVTTAALDVEYVDQGPLQPSFGGAITTPATWAYVENIADANTHYVPENIHLGRTIRPLSCQSHHFTHGFVGFSIPKPVVRFIKIGGSTLRLEGFYFTAPDPSATSHTGSTFDGTVGGAWVFIADSSGAEYQLSAVQFETGKAGSAGIRSVLGYDGTKQTSTGHVLHGTMPAGLTDGVYDILIRQYRNYGPLMDLHIDTVTYSEVLVLDSAVGFGLTTFGVSAYGA